jgi:hypothetical protein
MVLPQLLLVPKPLRLERCSLIAAASGCVCSCLLDLVACCPAYRNLSGSR